MLVLVKKYDILSLFGINWIESVLYLGYSANMLIWLVYDWLTG